jgi:4-hydroxyphenylpyruvate dioxygenase-like putative hemolysin
MLTLSTNPIPTAFCESVRHIDHITYVTLLSSEREFIARWTALGFHEHVRLRTALFPATHIALVSGINTEYPWATMTGLSVSEDPNSPINQFVSRYGEGIQHTAYNIDPIVDMEELYQQMKQLGWNFMTPVLAYKDEAGALLKQMFVAPSVPYGTFIEFAQRLIGPNGKAFDSFDTTNIDDLYQHYADYSKWLGDTSR